MILASGPNSEAFEKLYALILARPPLERSYRQSWEAEMAGRDLGEPYLEVSLNFLFRLP